MLFISVRLLGRMQNGMGLAADVGLNVSVIQSKGFSSAFQFDENRLRQAINIMAKEASVDALAVVRNAFFNGYVYVA